jgi:hypothetical protein
MILRDEIKRLYATITPSPVVYKVRGEYSWSSSFSLQKTGGPVFNTDHDETFLTRTVLREAREDLSEDLTRHELRPLDSKATTGQVFGECILLCTNFIEDNLKKVNPRQHKLFKYFNNLSYYNFTNNDKYEDIFYGFALYINKTEFNGRDDPQTLATLAAFQVLKDKMITELNIKEPQPKKRRG